ncbi:MAG: RNA polymerase III C11 subunit [Stictis urceolatum]|nr:RNA polymerase III C11 subunit [Stictis urceolata]
MLLFCPLCGNKLIVTRGPSDDEHPTGRYRMDCRTCTYIYNYEETLYERKDMKAKEAEDVMGGSEAWENVEQAKTQCPAENCNGDHAYFFQKQIRSADEPMTTFYMVSGVRLALIGGERTKFS